MPDILESSQEHPLMAGNTADDDPQVIDAMFSETQEPPDPSASLEPPDGPLPVPERRPTRVLTGNMLIDPAWSSAVELSPVDVNRVSFTIAIVTPGAATDYINLADDPAKLEIDDGSGRVYATPPVDMLRGHTGPIYIRALNAAAPVQVQWWTVTL